MSRLRLGLELDGTSRGRQVREIVTALARLPAVRGALLVAPDGFVIASEVASPVAVEPVAALAATLGRDLEVGASRLGRGNFQTAMFSADDGTLLLATCRIGFVVMLVEREANVPAIRDAMAEAVALLESAWAPAAATGARPA
jgi:predicted regulator of Ras-like GTPase activity (Roadblock/LC7/MglB family)